jgi:hypothetical protein
VLSLLIDFLTGANYDAKISKPPIWFNKEIADSLPLRKPAKPPAIFQGMRLISKPRLLIED